MTRILTLLASKGGEKVKYKKLKDFNATTNAEQLIASALYEGYRKVGKDGKVLITKYCADGYGYYSVNAGQFKLDVTDDDEVKGLNHKLIQQFFEEYKQGIQKAIVVLDAYTFLRQPRANNLQPYTVKQNIRFDFRVFEPFIADVIAYPQKYGRRLTNICYTVYGGNASLYRANITENMVNYPEWLQPKGFKSERVEFSTWTMEAELDGKLVSTSVQYDPHGIREYGPVGEIELAGKLVEMYILSELEDSYKKYTENNMDYKIVQVVERLNRYISETRGVIYRATDKMPQPEELIVDMTDLLGCFNDKRFTKEDIYAVINYFKHNKNIFMQYYEQSNKCMDYFYPWFAGRMSKGQKLFKNVPK